MADTTFAPGTLVASTWLNDVNRFTYDAPKTIGAGLVGTTEGVTVQEALNRRLSIASMTGAIGTLAGRSVYNTLPANFQYLDAQSGNLYVRTGPAGNWSGPFPFGGGTVSVNVGNVYTGSPGSSVIVNNVGTPQNVILDFTIPQGIPGTNGANGAPGAPGTAATISVGTVSTGAPGSSATVTNSGTSSAAVFNFSIPQGNAGPANTLSIGTVTSGPANATITGTSPNQTLNLVLPPGANGSAATIAVGTTTTLAPGSPATVTNVGTSSAAVLNFGIPQGVPGGGGGSGDVVGPASSVSGNVAVFSGTTGKVIADSGAPPLTIGTTATTAKAGNYQPASTNITDSTATGRALLTTASAAAARTTLGATTVGSNVFTATDAAAARTAIGAGTSNLVIGTTSTTAKAGDYVPPIATQPQAEAGTNNTEYMTPLRTAQAIAALAPSGGSPFTGATSTTNGAQGSVPAPLAGQQNRFLKGDGTWGTAAMVYPLFSPSAADLNYVPITTGNPPLQRIASMPIVNSAWGTQAIVGASNGTITVAIPVTTAILTSPSSSTDARTWTSRGTAKTAVHYLMCDGVTFLWTDRGASTPNQVSTDGINWTATSAFPTGQGTSLTGAAQPGGSGRFIATSVFSTDSGATWTSYTRPAGAWVEMTAVPGLFVGRDSTSSTTYYTSPTGATGTWTTRTMPTADLRIVETVDGAELYCSGPTNTIYKCTDGINWIDTGKQRLISGTTMINGIPFVASSTSAAQISYPNMTVSLTYSGVSSSTGRVWYKHQNAYYQYNGTGGGINYIDPTAIDPTLGIFA